MNEKEALITSMNLYEFSQANNNEMGVYLTKETDQQLYNDIDTEAKRLIRISEEIKVSVEKVLQTDNLHVKNDAERTVHKMTGFCIRTGVPIPFNIEIPMCSEAHKSWSKYKNPEYPENFCHFSGEPSNHETSKGKPILHKNWKKAKELFDDLPF